MNPAVAGLFRVGKFGYQIRVCWLLFVVFMSLIFLLLEMPLQLVNTF